MIERREYPRVDDLLSINYRLLNSTGPFIDTVCKNISVGGLCFPVMESLKQDSLLDIEINIRGIKKNIKSQGRVAWSKKREDKRYPYVVGFEFTEIEDSERDFILHYVWEKLKT